MATRETVPPFFVSTAMKNAAQTLKAKSKNSRTPRELQERLDMSQSTVDRKKCIIYGIKILGRESQNKHGMPGVTGTDYPPEVHARTQSLYEGMEVNVGHPPRNDPDAERPPQDRNGVLFDVAVKNGETFGNWQLIPSHEMTPIFLDCAENPKLHSQFAMSHNAKGYGDVREGRYRITEIPLVRSVDVVTRGGCNRTLFESKESTMKKKFKTILESASKETKARFAPLLEMYEDIGDMQADPLPPEPDAPDEPASYESHCAEMVKAIIMHDDMTADEKIEKIKVALKVLGDKEEEPVATDIPADITEDEPDGDEDMPAKKDDKLESREKQELATLRSEKKARELCESLEFTPTAIQLKALVNLGSSEQKQFIREQKTLATPGKTKVVARTATGRNTLESRERGAVTETSKKAFAAALRG